MTEVFVGEIKLLPYSFTPMGWLPCNGQTVPIREFETLFALLGVVYGGDGINNFGLPDLNGRVPVCLGQGGGLTLRHLGEKGGNEQETIAAGQAPVHSHNLMASTIAGKLAASSAAADVKSPAGNSLSANQAGNAFNRFNTAAPDVAMKTGSIEYSVMTNEVGSAAPAKHDNVQPFLAVQYCINYDGIFPSQG